MTADPVASSRFWLESRGRTFGIEVFELHGSLGDDSAQPLEEELATIAEGEVTEVALDLADVDGIAPSALEVLVQLDNRLRRAGGGLTLVEPNPPVISALCRSVASSFAVVARADEGAGPARLATFAETRRPWHRR